MRKKNRVVMVALAIMISCSLLGVTVAAGQADGMAGTDSSEASEEIGGTDSSDVGEDLPDADNQDATAEGTPDMDNQGAIAEETLGTDNQDVVADVPDTDSSNVADEMLNTDSHGAAEMPDVDSPDKEETGSEAGDMLSLQIPQKLGIVIDPWEMDGKGQIYSEQYIIRNVGEDAGVLTLSFLCRRGENSNAIIRTDKAGLHDDENKSIYIEMIFGDADRMALSEEGLEYQAQLEPGEELVVSFVGEVNENASENWGNGDVEVEGIYSWSVAEDAGAEAQNAEELKDSEVLNGNGPEDADDLQSETKASGEGDSLSGGEDGEATLEGSEGLSASEDVKDDAGANLEENNDSLPMESVQNMAELGVEATSEATSEALLGEEKETPQQKIDEEDMTGAESQETDQNPEIDNVEDGQEG